MWQYEKNNQTGMILIVVLIFLFILTLITARDSDDVIINHKMQFVMHNQALVFVRAVMGEHEMILALEGISFALPASPIAVQATSTVIKVDRCGNQTVLIKSVASNQFDKVVLNSLHIFARVPKLKKCKKIPLHQVLWWQ